MSEIDMTQFAQPYSGSNADMANFLVPKRTTVQLADATNSINTEDKYVGKIAFDTTLGIAVWAASAAAAGAWIPGARLAAAETVTGQWTFDAGVTLDDGSEAAPAIKGSDSDSGLFFESSGTTLSFTRNGSRQWSLSNTSMGQDEANRPVFFSENATATNPNCVPNAGDVDTGLGANAADQLSLIAGSIEGIRLSEASSAVLQTVQSNVSLTAHTGSSQGDGVITSSFNVYDTVGTTGDAATLPAAFAVGTKVYIKNGAAANSMDVFPASGDDAGGGVDTAIAIAAGDFAVFLATTANATWEKIMGGTA